jgi:AI-2 transport protein TqsA
MSDRSPAGYLVSAAAIVIVIAGMRAATSILVPFLIAVFLAIVCAQLVDWLQRARIPRPAALAIVIATVTLAVFLSMVFVGASVGQLVRELPKYETKIADQKSELVGWLNRHGMTSITVQQLKFFDPGTGISLFASVLSGLSSVLSNAFTILLLWAFLLPGVSKFPEKLQRAAGAEVTQRMEGIISSIRQYVGMKAVISIATGALIAMWLRILGVGYPFLWGIIALVLNFVPNIGSLMAAVPAVVFVLIQQGPTAAMCAAAGYLVVNGVLGNVVEPRVMGHGLGMSAFVILASLVFWGWVLGPVGMLLAVPLTMTAKIILESSDETRWLAALMGPA